MTENVRVTREGATTTITLARPEKRNALSAAMMTDVTAALAAAGASDTLAVVIAADGPVFSAGHNFGDLAGADLRAARDLFLLCTRMMETVQGIPQPVIAKVAARVMGLDDPTVKMSKSLADKRGHAVKLLDVGSGAGLPGVVMAICCPEVDVHCVDTVAKKAAFIQQVAATLRLPNLRGVHARVESLAGPYDVVSARAFASLPDLVNWSARALGEGGVWLAMKGKHPADELAALPAGVQVFHVEPLQVPGLAAERCIVWLRPVA